MPKENLWLRPHWTPHSPSWRLWPYRNQILYWEYFLLTFSACLTKWLREDSRSLCFCWFFILRLTLGEDWSLIFGLNLACVLGADEFENLPLIFLNTKHMGFWGFSFQMVLFVSQSCQAHIVGNCKFKGIWRKKRIEKKKDQVGEKTFYCVLISLLLFTAKRKIIAMYNVVLWQS